MEPALNLTEQDRLCFMQALNAVAYRTTNPGSVWLELLRQFRDLLGVFEDDYQFQAGVPGIAEKVNQIANSRARLYFLRIIHDIHLSEVAKGRRWSGNKDASIAKFEHFYSELVEAIQLY